VFDPLGPLRGMIIGVVVVILFAMVAVVALGKFLLYAIGIAIAIRLFLWLTIPRKAR